MSENATEKPKLLLRLLEGSFLALFHTTRYLSKILPPPYLHRLVALIGDFFFYARPGMRRRLEAKISDALPEITDPRELARIGRQVCGCIFMPMVDIFTLARHSDRFMRELQVENEEYLAEAEALGKGVIFASAHIGAITIIHAVMVRYGKLYTPITFPAEDTPLPRYVETLQFYGGSLGCDTEEPVFWAGEEDIIPRIQEHLAERKNLGLTFDVPGNTIVEFFGRPAAMAGGMGHFAYDTGAPILPFYLLRGKSGLDNRLIFDEPIIANTDADRKTEVKAVMREVMKAGERMIKRAPEQWMSWFGMWQWWDRAEELKKEKAQPIPKTKTE